MKTQKTNNKKTVNQKSLLAEKENEVLNALNISDEKLFKELEEIELSEFSKKITEKKKISKGEKNVIEDSQYIYSEEIQNKYNEEENKEKKQKLIKQYRTSIRKKMKKTLSNIVYYFSKKDTENLKKEISFFHSFYKENYKINDLNIESIFNKNIDEDTRQIALDSLKIINTIKNK